MCEHPHSGEIKGVFFLNQQLEQASNLYINAHSKCSLTTKFRNRDHCEVPHRTCSTKQIRRSDIQTQVAGFRSFRLCSQRTPKPPTPGRSHGPPTSNHAKPKCVWSKAHRGWPWLEGCPCPDWTFCRVSHAPPAPTPHTQHPS